MFTDEERRDVAQALCRNAENNPTMPLLLNIAFATHNVMHKDCCEYTLSKTEAALILANLIEPEPEPTCRNISSDGGFSCSFCGCEIGDTTSCGDEMPYNYPDAFPSYCPNCGRRVENAY